MLRKLVPFEGATLTVDAHPLHSCVPQAVLQPLALRRSLDASAASAAAPAGAVAEFPLAPPPEASRALRTPSFITSLVDVPGVGLVASCVDHSALVFALPSGELVARLEGHKGSVTAATWCPLDAPAEPAAPAGRPGAAPTRLAGTEVATASSDALARVFDAATGELRFVLAGHTGPVRSLAYCARVGPQALRCVLTASPMDRTMRLFEIEREGACLALVWRPFAVVCCGISDAHVVTGCFSNTVRVWRVEAGAVAEGTAEDASVGEVERMFAAATATAATAATAATTAQPRRDGIQSQRPASPGVARSAACQPLAIEEQAALQRHAKAVTSVCMLPERRVATGSEDRSVLVWDLDTLAVVFEVRLHSAFVCDIRSSCLWATRRAPLTASPHAHAHAHAPGHHHHQQRAVSLDAKRCAVWDLATRTLLASWDVVDGGGAASSVALSADGTFVYVAVANRIKAYDLAASERAATLVLVHATSGAARPRRSEESPVPGRLPLEVCRRVASFLY